MASDFFASFATARAVFEEASDAVGVDMARLCFELEDELNRTEYAQPAIVTAEIAMLRVLEAEHGLYGDYFGGHSLGEYSALVASGVLQLADAVRATRQRGALMQRAVPLGEGAMIAVIAKGVAERDLSSAIGGLNVDLANRNSADQVVFSGALAAVAVAAERIASTLAHVEHRIVQLNVSAPFHSRMMMGVEEKFRDVLAEIQPRVAAARARVVTSNASGVFHHPTADAVVSALVRQISAPVDWVSNMLALSAVAGRIVEIGPGKPLRSFFKTIGRHVTSIGSTEAAEKALGRPAT
jgi:[acyl-carrier-protein] S-malonyltransferase/trans-AT polyketide synthase/acyltransferase/oxidoreductase domain-containing protein